MPHWKYLPIIATINKALLKKLLLSIILVLWHNFLNIFIKIAILGKIYQCNSCYSKLEQHWTKFYVSTVALLSTFLITPFWFGPLHLSGFSQNSPYCVACFTFGRFKISTLTPSRFKNETNDALKLLGRNDNH